MRWLLFSRAPLFANINRTRSSATANQNPKQNTHCAYSLKEQEAPLPRRAQCVRRT